MSRSLLIVTNSSRDPSTHRYQFEKVCRLAVLANGTRNIELYLEFTHGAKKDMRPRKEEQVMAPVHTPERERSSQAVLLDLKIRSYSIRPYYPHNTRRCKELLMLEILLYIFMSSVCVRIGQSTRRSKSLNYNANKCWPKLEPSGAPKVKVVDVLVGYGVLGNLQFTLETYQYLQRIHYVPYFSFHIVTFLFDWWEDGRFWWLWQDIDMDLFESV
ncbi:hypothetical protein Trydic_g7927 [Trypoxylus dichotomus]